MSRTPLLERGPRLIEPRRRVEDVRHEPVVLLTEAEAAARVRVFDGCKNPVRQFQEWARKVGLPVKRIGRKRAYDARVLDAFIDGQRWTKRHGVKKSA